MSDDLDTSTRQSGSRESSSRMAAAHPFHGRLGPEDYDALEEELRANAHQIFSGAVAASAHTLIQEEDEVEEMIDVDSLPYRLLEEQHRNSNRAIDEVNDYDPPPALARNLMHSASPFSLENDGDVNEASFMGWFPKGDGTLTFTGEDGELQYIHDLNLWLISDRSPLLSMAFEEARSGLQLHLDVLTSLCAYPFVRFLYTGNYALMSAARDLPDDVPTSVLMHAQLYRLGVIFELEELRQQAYVNVLRQCEFGCSSPDKPIDLCAAIGYAYDHLPEHVNLLDALVNYCVACFLRHRLADDEHFRRLAHDVHPFHQALCRESIRREDGFETASAIIRLPFKPLARRGTVISEELGNYIADAIYHFHSLDDAEPKAKTRHDDILGGCDQTDVQTLALRPFPHTSASPHTASATTTDAGIHRPSSRARAPTGTGEEEAESEGEYEIIPRLAEVEDLDSSDESIVEVPAALQQPISLQAWAEQGLVDNASHDAGPDSDLDDWTVVGND